MEGTGATKTAVCIDPEVARARPAERCSAATSPCVIEVRRMLAAGFFTTSVGYETVPTGVIGRSLVVIVVVRRCCVTHAGGMIALFPVFISLRKGNPPFITGLCSRIHAAIFSFCAGVIPPISILGRSLLEVHGHRLANCCASSIHSMMYWSSHLCRTVRL